MFVFNTSKVKISPHALSVISYNISNASVAYDKETLAKASKKERMFEYLKRFSDEDVLCLQEVGAYATDILKKSFPSHEMYQTNKGAVILSKHRIINKGSIDFGTKTNSCLWADIIFDIDTIRVYSIHLQSNRITKDANQIISDGKIDNKKTWLDIKSILKKFKQSHITRTSQAKEVKVHIDNSPFPVLVCGDFNDTPVSYTYRHLSERLKDAFVEKGNGLGTTFNGRIPLLRIDYVLSDPSFDILKYNVIQEDYSDHYAVACLLSIQK
jgi:endonuclease/exonuclease/phosphatase family metal-dependent hydrolase